MFQDRMRCIPRGLRRAESCRPGQADLAEWRDGGSREFVGGDSISMADILLFCFVDFGQMVGQKLNEDNKNITAWYERMKARPSAAA